ncbi:MAG: pyruvate dehydrogenase (acetyl-transferring) E1 component subunit alpha [Acidimicrobiia bacterium]|nr:pyruvate dehydrogenase (acetyl-transferring) E1 component subunit alpha [Acidimicrobiia bacterium]
MPEVDLTLRQILDQDGNLVGDMPALADKELVEMYRFMAASRDFDRRAMAAQRQGRIGTYPMLEGHEAAQVGAAYALGPNDFVYPAYREHAVQMVRGMPLDVILSYWRGLPTTEWDVHGFKMMTNTVPIATHIPQAVGHAYAARQRGEDVVTAAFFGDGTTSENDFHSGLNFAGVWKTPSVFVCENNSYAISVPFEKQTASETIVQKATAYGIAGVRVDGMDVLATYQATKEAVERARAGDGPTLIEAVCYRFGAHATADDARRYRPESEEELWRPKDPVPRFRKFLEGRGLWDQAAEDNLLEEAGDAFDIAIAKLETIEPTRDSIVRHAYDRIPQTMVRQLHEIQRGAGEPETTFSDDDVWQLGPDPEPNGPTERWNMAEAINATLAQAMERDDTAIVLGEDVGLVGGVFRITEGLQEKFGDERVIDTPLNESGIVGAAIGMGISGSRAIAEIQFDGFVYPAFDQIVSHLGRLRFRSRSNATAPIVVRWPNGAGIGAHEMHCDSPEAYFAHAPGQVVVIPSTPWDAKGLLAAAIASPDPVIFLEPKVLYRAFREDVPVEHYEIPIGTARIRAEGTDLTIATYGGMVQHALEAAATAAEEGISVEVIDLRTIYPWDEDTVAASVEKTGRLLVVQEPQRTGGIGAEIAAQIGERCGYSLLSPVRRLGATDAPWPQFLIEEHALLTPGHVLHALREVVAG